MAKHLTARDVRLERMIKQRSSGKLPGQTRLKDLGPPKGVSDRRITNAAPKTRTPGTAQSLEAALKKFKDSGAAKFLDKLGKLRRANPAGLVIEQVVEQVKTDKFSSKVQEILEKADARARKRR